MLNFTAASKCTFDTRQTRSRNAIIFFFLVNHNGASISGFVTIGTVFDVGVWYFVKDVKIFDEEIELQDIAEEPGETL